MKVARKHLQIANQRKDFLHNMTTALIRQYQVIKIEDLNVKGMVKNHCLSLAISELGFGEFKRQLIYKAAWYGREIRLVNRWFPSSKTCSSCGIVKPELKLSERVFRCESCNTNLDRDLNAAINILNTDLLKSKSSTDIASGSLKPVEMNISLSAKQESLLKS
jgi:putative transposase